jgi:hypothetical protein
MSGFVYFHGFGCRQNGGMTADTDFSPMSAAREPDKREYIDYSEISSSF